MTTFTFILVVMLIAGIMIVFSKDRGCIGLIIGIILIMFSVSSLIGTCDKADKEFVEDVQLGQYQMNVQEAMEDNNKTVKEMAVWLMDNNTNKFTLVKYSNNFGCVVFEGAEEIYTLSNKELRRLIEKEYIIFIY